MNLHPPLRRASSLALALLLLLSACLPATLDPALADQVRTQAAQTVESRLTLQAGESAVALLTQLASQPSSTPYLPTQPPPSATHTLTLPPPTPTQLAASPTLPPIPTPAAPQVPCEQAEFIGDISIPPGTTLFTSAHFIKTWRVRNSGACAWTTAYSLAFASGAMLSDSTAAFLPSPVAPGETTDLSLAMRVPSNPGAYQGFWALRNPAGQVMPLTRSASGWLEARIQAVLPQQWPGASFDLAANLCGALWQSAAGALGCPGLPQEAAGSASLLDSPSLEGRRLSTYGLLTRPNQQTDGWVRGIFPAYSVREGDHFLAEIGCLAGSSGCEVLFELDYRLLSGSYGYLGKWRESLDGQTSAIDIDLSPLAGRSIQLVFTVTNRGAAAAANAVWLAPRIQNLAPASQVVFTWRRESSPAAPCLELRVFVSDDLSAEAVVYGCNPGTGVLRSAALTDQELAQLAQWVKRLKSFEAEIYQASPGQPVLIWLALRGLGGLEAGEAEIQALSAWAESIASRLLR